MSRTTGEEPRQDLAAVADRLEAVVGELSGLLQELRSATSGTGESGEVDADTSGSPGLKDPQETGLDGGGGPDEIRFHGLDGDTGRYAFRGRTFADLARAVPARPAADEDEERELENRQAAERLDRQGHLGPVAGVDPNDLSEAGWGVIFPDDVSSAVRDQLSPLLEHRRRQAGRYYREFRYRRGETVTDFLGRHDRRPGPANPAKVPYHLLLAGGPEEIPYGFEHLLAVDYAVGRLHFDDPQGYGAYARSVVEVETSGFAAARRATFFGPDNPDDAATSQTCEHLVRRLAGWARGRDGWQVRELVAGDATKPALAGQLRAGEAPALLFAAAHGLAFKNGSRRQRDEQGALLCQEWPGPEQWKKRIPGEHYFAASDVGDDAHVRGLIAFQFACHGCGTPRYDQYAHRGQGPARELAPAPFVARLPQRLLSHPRGGALAVIGHVGRTWGWSYISPHTETSQIEVFQSTLHRLLDGCTVGWAMEYVRRSYATRAVWLSRWMPKIHRGLRRFNDQDVVDNWTAFNDARNYAVLGDPAVRLPVAASTESGAG